MEKDIINRLKEADKMKKDIINQLKKAYIENKLDDRIKHFSKYKLLIIDEIGYLPIGEQEAKMFFQLIDRRSLVSG